MSCRCDEILNLFDLTLSLFDFSYVDELKYLHKIGLVHSVPTGDYYLECIQKLTLFLI